MLDLFSGSGIMALETLSRGAATAVSIEQNRRATQSMHQLRTTLNLTEEAWQIWPIHVEQGLINLAGQAFDLVFADPPYYKNLGDRDFVKDLLGNEFLAKQLANDGVLIVEDPPANHRELDLSDGWDLLDQRSYGSCGILFYQHKKPTPL